MCSVSAANATQMALIHSRIDELRERFLLQRGGMPVAEPLGRCERGNQRLGYDQVTDAERGKDRARERSDVDDASLGVQSLQGFQWLLLVAKFPVVVVLNDYRVFAPGPVEERHAASECKNRAGRKLV